MIYNDLKLDNILIGFDDKIAHGYTSNNMFEGCTINLIDFGFAQEYIDQETNQHHDQKDVSCFRGNIAFSSVSQLNFKSTCRRDDLISLCQILVFMLN